MYMDTMLLDRREYPVNKENTLANEIVYHYFLQKKVIIHYTFLKSTLDELCHEIF